MKDFKEIIRETEPQGCYRLKVTELLELAQQENFQSILDAYNFGFYQGMRYERNQQKKKQRKA